MTELPRNTILIGDALTRLRDLPPDSVDCVVTSPPYYLLRDYGITGQLGLEPTVTDWVGKLRSVTVEVARVLKPRGSVWLDLGDSFSRAPKYGAPAKGLLLAPERLLIALAADGWIIRAKVIWAKPNPMPHSVGDRLNTTYEVVYHLVRQGRYFFDLDAIREPHRTTGNKRQGEPIGKTPEWAGPLAGSQDGLRRARADGSPGHELGKNPGDVWTIATRGYRGAHFATFPPELVRRPILATCPEAICASCHQPWKRQVTVRRLGTVGPAKPDRFVLLYANRWRTIRTIGDLVPCGCGAPTQPGVVLDPFFGTGTVGAVASDLGRDWIGIELNPAYVALAEQRLAGASRPPTEVAA
jgi:site-specific DNA-methyltransferase (adenine-specific)